MITVFDSHWLPYRNAIIKAYALDNKTVPVKFYNITDADVEPTESIGTIVQTDERGYLHYSGAAGLENVLCLAVKESAIIQASRPTGEIIAQWAFKAPQDTLTTDDFGVLNYSDGTTAFDPTVPRKWTLKNFALASDVRQGQWEEAQTLLGIDDTSVTLDRWQSVIFIPSGFISTTLAINVSNLLESDEPRFGLKFIILNGSDHAVTVSQSNVTSGSTAIIPAGHQICGCAAYYYNGTQWVCSLAFDDTPNELTVANTESVERDTALSTRIDTLTTRVQGLRYMPINALDPVVTGTWDMSSGNYGYHLTINNDPVKTPFIYLNLTAETINTWTGGDWGTGSQARQVDILWPAATQYGATVQIWWGVSLDAADSDNPVVLTYNGTELARRSGHLATSNLDTGEITMIQPMTKGNESPKLVFTNVADKIINRYA